MGDYTANQKFYKIDGSELVNVDQDLNYNLQRADERIKPLVEYQFTDEPTVTGSSLPKETGFKFYKTYTNSVYAYRNGGVFQDPLAQVLSWSSSGITYETGWTQMTGDDRIGYHIDGNLVRWRGRLVASDGSELPANTVVNFLTPPDAALPQFKSKYLTVYGGNAASGDFQTFKVYVPNRNLSDKRLEFIKYGGNSTGTDMRYMSLNGMYYTLDDPL